MLVDHLVSAFKSIRERCRLLSSQSAPTLLFADRGSPYIKPDVDGVLRQDDTSAYQSSLEWGREIVLPPALSFLVVWMFAAVVMCAFILLCLMWRRSRRNSEVQKKAAPFSPVGKRRKSMTPVPMHASDGHSFADKRLSEQVGALRPIEECEEKIRVGEPRPSNSFEHSPASASRFVELGRESTRDTFGRENMVEAVQERSENKIQLPRALSELLPQMPSNLLPNVVAPHTRPNPTWTEWSGNEEALDEALFSRFAKCSTLGDEPIAAVTNNVRSESEQTYPARRRAAPREKPERDSPLTLSNLAFSSMREYHSSNARDTPWQATSIEPCEALVSLGEPIANRANSSPTMRRYVATAYSEVGSSASTSMDVDSPRSNVVMLDDQVIHAQHLQPLRIEIAITHNRESHAKSANKRAFEDTDSSSSSSSDEESSSGEEPEFTPRARLTPMNYGTSSSDSSSDEDDSSSDSSPNMGEATPQAVFHYPSSSDSSSDDEDTEDSSDSSESMEESSDESDDESESDEDEKNMLDNGVFVTDGGDGDSDENSEESVDEDGSDANGAESGGCEEEGEEVEEKTMDDEDADFTPVTPAPTPIRQYSTSRDANSTLEEEEADKTRAKGAEEARQMMVQSLQDHALQQDAEEQLEMNSFAPSQKEVSSASNASPSYASAVEDSSTLPAERANSHVTITPNVVHIEDETFACLYGKENLPVSRSEADEILRGRTPDNVGSQNLPINLD